MKKPSEGRWAKPEPWVMPVWMKGLPDLGGELDFPSQKNRVEDLVNGSTLVQVNAPLALIEMGCQAQVQLLERLHRKGMLVVECPVCKGHGGGTMDVPHLSCPVNWVCSLCKGKGRAPTLSAELGEVKKEGGPDEDTD